MHINPNDIHRALCMIKTALINTCQEITVALQQCSPLSHNAEIIVNLLKSIHEEFNLFVSISNQLQNFRDRVLSLRLSKQLDEGFDGVFDLTDCPENVD
jgi:hypothetical protein